MILTKEEVTLGSDNRYLVRSYIMKRQGLELKIIRLSY